MDNSFNALMQSLKKYFSGVRAEWGKITWPERNTVIHETIFVIIIIFALTVTVYIMDLIFKFLTNEFVHVIKNML